MKQRLIKNIGLKLISLIIAFIFWMGVHNISNPEITRNKSVDLEILNDDIIKNAGKTFTLLGGGSVNISYKIRARDESKVNSEDFRAYIDLANLYDVTGAVPVNVEVINHKEFIKGQVVAKPTTVRVITEDLQRKEFEIKEHILGKPKDGYTVGGVQLSPSTVYINGPMSLIGQISSVAADINVDNLDDSKSGKTTLSYYDANGNILYFDEHIVYFENEITNYKINILKGKSLDLEFEVEGEPAQGYKYTGITSSTNIISVVGKDEDLEKISKIVVPKEDLNIDGATGSKSVVINVAKYLPEGISINSPSEVNITMNVEAENSEKYNILTNNIKIIGKDDNYHYAITPDSVNVIISKSNDENEADSDNDRENQQLNIEKLQPVVDVTLLSKGSHIGSLELKLPKGYKLESYSQFNILVYDEQDKEQILNIYNFKDKNKNEEVQNQDKQDNNELNN